VAQNNGSIASGCNDGFYLGTDKVIFTVPYVYAQVMSIIGDYQDLTWSGFPAGSITLNGTDNRVGTAKIYYIAGVHVVETIYHILEAAEWTVRKDSHTVISNHSSRECQFLCGLRCHNSHSNLQWGRQHVQLHDQFLCVEYNYRCIDSPYPTSCQCANCCSVLRSPDQLFLCCFFEFYRYQYLDACNGDCELCDSLYGFYVECYNGDWRSVGLGWIVE
jgi:hypothetical protein